MKPTSKYLLTQFGVAPSWVLRGMGITAGVDMDFLTNRFYGSTLSKVACSRASNATYFDQAGLLKTASSNTLRQTFNPATLAPLGLWIEESRTNNSLWCRDMTNAAWVKVNMTAALTAAGIDGTANSASTLTATAGNGTILQTITLGSAADTYSVWLKRVSGSGAINIAADGVTWTAAAVTTTWTKFQVQQTLANPVFGIQIVTNGDVIAADFNQLETGAMDSSPILTTTVAVTRAADAVTLSSPPTFGTAYTLYGEATPLAPVTAATQFVIAASDGTTNNRLLIQRTTPAGAVQYLNSTGGSATAGGATAWTQGAIGKFAATSQASDQAGSFNGGAVSTGSAALPIGVNAIAIGNNQAGTGGWINGYIRRIAIWPTTRISNAGLQAVTT